MLGDIGLSPSHVFLPSGTYPIKGTQWTVMDMSRRVEKVSTAGIVLTVVFVWFCLIGLLFLLMKDERTEGYIQVTVTGPGLAHTTMVPAYGPQAIGQVMNFVNYARSLAA